jgi:hypothetical protein
MRKTLEVVERRRPMLERLVQPLLVGLGRVEPPQLGELAATLGDEMMRIPASSSGNDSGATLPPRLFGTCKSRRGEGIESLPSGTFVSGREVDAGPRCVGRGNGGAPPSSFACSQIFAMHTWDPRLA